VRLLRRRSRAEQRLRDSIAAAGGSLRPLRPSGVWHPWVDRALQSTAEVQQATEALRRAGLVPHQDPPKNWDALVAVGTILERVPRGAPVIDMGAPRYAPLLRWLYQYGYRDLTGIDLVYERAQRYGPLQLLPMDLTATSFPDRSFAAIACLSVIEHGVEVDAFLRECARLLRPGGVAVVSTDYWPTRLDTAGRTAYGHEVHVFDRPEVEALLALAAQRGLHPVRPVVLDASEQVVHWARMSLDYTFLVLVLERQADGG
jgi:SAM-dependent methyltransferase